MKLDKNQKKQLDAAIRICARKKGYRIRENSIFTRKNDVFIHCDYLIIKSQKMVFGINIKNYDYDHIFWDIMQMPDNIKEPDSFRACGAFIAPSILLKEGEFEITDKYEEQAEYLMELIDKSSHSFLAQYDIDEYVINHECGIGVEELKCLAYLHMGKQKEAIEIAQDTIAHGDVGRFINEGKGFFEWVLFMFE